MFRHDSPDRAQFARETGSVSLVRGKPTEHVHMAFPAAEHNRPV